MELMFSTQDEELKKQVDEDIKSAEAGDVVDTDEVKYEKTDNGDVAITDKENGEVTIAQRSEDEPDTYDLIAVPDEQLERFVHPSDDGVTKSAAQGAPDEHVENHIPAGSISEATGEVTKVEDTAKAGPQEAVCPECGKAECECEDEQKEFSVTSDNIAWQKIFSMPQEFVDYLFSEVIDSEETSKVGDLKVEKIADEDNAVVVTSESTGDQVKVVLNGDEMEVTELDSRNFSNYLPLFVIGVQPYDHIIVEAQEYDQESAEQLVAQLTEDGVEACQIFEDPESARDYAINLLNNLGANPAAGDVDEVEEQKEYSEYYDCAAFYTTSYRTDDSVLMSRMFSEQAAGIAETRDVVEVAIADGNQAALGEAIVTPVDAQNAVIQDGDEFTLATLSGEDMVLEKIDADEAQDILGDDSVLEAKSEENDDPFELEEDEEREFSEDIYSDEAETRFFSENEEMTDYMQRLFSDESDQNFIEEAIAGGQEIENEDEIVTPIDSETAIIEDKGNGEFTKAVILDEDRINVHPISEDEAENLLGDIVVDENSEEEVKEFSDYDVYTNEAETRFFSEAEEMTAYMERIFSEESDQDKIEEAIQEGKQIENESEIITPVDATTAVVEDKENGEFTKAEIADEDNLELNPISEEEADELTKDLKVSEEEETEGEEDDNEDDGEKKFSSPLDKFFADIQAAAAQPVVAQAVPAPAAAVAAPVAAAPADAAVVAPEEVPVEEQPVATVEQIEDKALAAVQSIKAAAEEATAQIMEAKAAPAVDAEPQIQEAQFSENTASEKTFSQDAQNDTLISWLAYK